MSPPDQSIRAVVSWIPPSQWGSPDRPPIPLLSFSSSLSLSLHFSAVPFIPIDTERGHCHPHSVHRRVRPDSPLSLPSLEWSQVRGKWKAPLDWD